ncbi:site-specific tyrosine recombinase/integron integrase [Clostridium magnum]|uniref:Tyrosine recombinase XerD n=1 Tax=Clostridium magnum DSM 2767 TaxID=1121326 RepID=A0A161W0R9_9CLOT|nr:site-specific tyrosine recombinase/integron integrase [Clostridium magnum]KZL88730.1 tyrosine recombinase XerD [Clostridium magnum DSM 2767]SHJ65848.1 integrase/recombinase XerD [Clostridium magnum DSM 2767]
MNCNQEAIIKSVGKISLEFPTIDQLKLRSILEEVFYKYDVLPQETALVASDVEEKLQIYLATKRLDGLSERTLNNYNYQLIIFASHLIKPIATITTMDLRMYLAARCKGMKPTSINGQISILKSFFSWLADEEYIPKDPARKLKQTKEPKRLRHALSDEEVEHLRQACKTDREKSIVEFLISTGCRLSEIVGINKDEINWHEMSLFVIGKGNKERKVYFNVKAKILLLKYLETRKDENPALFVAGKFPHGRMGGRSIEREVNKIAERAGFDKSIYPHLFRHSFATHNINSGMPLHILQHLMGHESPETTLVYSEVSEDNVRHEYKRIQ